MSQNQNQIKILTDILKKSFDQKNLDNSNVDKLIDSEDFQRDRVENSPLGEFQKETALTLEDFI